MNKKPKNLRSFFARFLLSKTEKVPEETFPDFQDFGIWKDVCEKIFAEPFPPQNSSSDFSIEDIERDKRVTFSKFSNWEIICQEILDTEYSYIYYQRGYDELLKRGKSKREILEMRKFAWHTLGWLNFPMMMWEWVNLDESDIHRAIQWLYDKKQISQEQQVEFKNFVKTHA